MKINDSKSCSSTYINAKTVMKNENNAILGLQDAASAVVTVVEVLDDVVDELVDELLAEEPDEEAAVEFDKVTIDEVELVEEIVPLTAAELSAPSASVASTEHISFRRSEEGKNIP